MMQNTMAAWMVFVSSPTQVTSRGKVAYVCSRLCNGAKNELPRTWIGRQRVTPRLARGGTNCWNLTQTSRESRAPASWPATKSSYWSCASQKTSSAEPREGLVALRAFQAKAVANSQCFSYSHNWGQLKLIRRGDLST